VKKWVLKTRVSTKNVVKEFHVGSLVYNDDSSEMKYYFSVWESNDDKSVLRPLTCLWSPTQRDGRGTLEYWPGSPAIFCMMSDDVYDWLCGADSSY